MTFTRELTPLRVLVTAYSVSAFGTYLDFVVLNLFAYRVTGSPLQTGLFMALRLTTSFAVGLAAGPIVQPHRRRRLLVGTDLTQALGLLVLVLAPGAAAHGLLYGLAVVAGASGTLHSVSLRSSVPDLVGPDGRVRANGLLVTGRSIGMTLGFAIAGLIVAGAGYRAAFVVDAATYVFSAAAISTLPFPGRALTAGERPDGGLAGVLRAHRESSVLWRLAPLTILMVPLRGVDALGSASHQVGIPIYASLVEPANPADFMGHFWAAWAIGNILAYQALARLRGGAPAGEAAFAVGTCLMSASFILAFTGLALPLLLAAALAAGLSDGFTEVTYVSRLQGLPDERRGYVFGLSAVAENSGLGVGMMICAVLLQRLPPLPVVGLMHGTAIVLALLFLALMLVRARSAARPAAEAGT